MSSTWLHLYVPGNPHHVFSNSLPPRPGELLGPATKDERDSDQDKPRVLVVDDERLIADSVAAILNLSGFEAVATYGGAEAIEFLHQQCPDIVLSDVVMPDQNGLQVAREALSKCPGTRIVLISGNAVTPSLLQHALPDKSSFELLAKPIHPRDLLSILRG